MNKRIPGLKRSLFRQLILDPIEGLAVAVILLIFAILPLPLAEAVGAFLGTVVGLFAWRRNKIGLFNLRVAFPEKSEKDFYQGQSV